MFRCPKACSFGQANYFLINSDRVKVSTTMYLLKTVEFAKLRNLQFILCKFPFLSKFLAKSSKFSSHKCFFANNGTFCGLFSTKGPLFHGLLLNLSSKDNLGQILSSSHVTLEVRAALDLML